MFKRRKRRKQNRRILASLLLLALLAYAALYYSNCVVKVNNYELSFAGLPASFDGYRIAQLSDIHGGDLLGEDGEKLISALKDEKPSIIVITGDIADEENPPEKLRGLLLRLTALAPVYYVTGNHEWAAGCVGELEALFEETGVTALRNEYVLLTAGGQSIALAGIDDPNGYADRKMPPQLMRELREEQGEIFTIMLAHRPEEGAAALELGCELALSGHNHGGLIRLPWRGGLIAANRELFPEYTRGAYPMESGSYLVVSAGLAKVGQAPRLFNPLDVPVITLRRSASSDLT